MSAENPSTITVVQADRVIALCTTDRVFFSPEIAALPPGDPVATLAAAKCLVARAYLRGDVQGPYDDQEADAAARILVELTARTWP